MSIAENIIDRYLQEGSYKGMSSKESSTLSKLLKKYKGKYVGEDPDEGGNKFSFATPKDADRFIGDAEEELGYGAPGHGAGFTDGKFAWIPN